VPIAFTREIAAAIVRCELTHRRREPIDLPLARRQHDAYEAALREAGCEVRRLTATPDMADAVFIEDTAVVLDELAIVTRPGAPSRRIETSAVAAALQAHRELRHVEAPGTADGGDVLVVGRRIFVGRSTRTNDAGISQLRGFAAPHGYEVVVLTVHGCLHLKSAVTAVADDLLLVNPTWLPPDAMRGFDVVLVHPNEPSGGNALRVGGRVIYSASFPETLERLRGRGLAVTAIDNSEIEKAEGAVTCGSLIVATKP
jgi:dimethylargininase